MNRHTLNHSRWIILPLFFHGFSHYVIAQSQLLPPPPPPPVLSSPRFDPTMAIIMIVSVAIFFILGFVSVYLRQCGENGMGFETTPATTIGGATRPFRRAARGLDASVIESFPTFLYSTVKGLKIGQHALECAICLNEFEDDETLRLIPKCCHVYHPDCIDAWLSFHNTCPVCRANLIPKPGELTDYEDLYFNINLGQPVHDEVNVESRTRTRTRNHPTTVLESPDMKLLDSVAWTNKSKPPRSKSTGWRSFGSSATPQLTRNPFIQPGENRERFTLRLPKDVQSRLVSSNLNRSKSFDLLTTVQSSRRGYRSGSVGSLNRLDRWEFSRTPPFISRTNSVLSTKDKSEPVGTGTGTGTSKGLLKWIKSPSDRRYSGIEEIGERSSDCLRSDNRV